MRTLRLVAISLGIMTAASVQAQDENESYFTKLTEPAYGLWSGGVLSRSPNYRGDDSEVTPELFIFGGYGPVFISANRFGYNFYKDGTWFVSAVGQLRTQSAKDGNDELGLKKRKTATEAGVQVRRRLPHGFITRLALLYDVSGTHESYEVDLQLYRLDNFGPVTLVSAIAVQYQPEKMVDYYYGAPGITTTTNYQADNQFIAELKLFARYPLSDDIVVFAGTRNYRYQSSIEDSPVADGRNIIQGFAGIGYQF